jgi:hypothetical protein
MATTTSGLRYPISSDDPDIPRDIRQLAEDVDDYLNATGSGAFSGVLPAIDINGNATTATTATQLATARTISLAGSVSGSASFNGSADITITATTTASNPTYNAQTGTTYTFVLTDVGKTVTASNASPQTYTIPPQASVTWLADTTLYVINLGAGIAYQTSEPVSPATGDIWIDSDDEVPSVDSTLYYRWTKTMSGGETSLSGTDDNSLALEYTPGYESVFINGVLQVRGSDYVATDGTTVTGLTALTASDVVMVESIVAYSVGDTYTQSHLGSLLDAKSPVSTTGLVLISSTTSGTMTGTIKVYGYK